MVHARAELPAGHGELVAQPAYSEWSALVEANRDAAASWEFDVAGLAAAEMRDLVRREALDAARVFSARLGVAVREPGEPGAPVVATGHQPELYHPGVWIKDFLLDRLALDAGASAFDLVVDSDGFDTIGVSSPCLTPGVARCKQYLAVGTPDGSFATTPVPDAAAISGFCAAADEMLASLPALAVRRHFARFCGLLREAAVDAASLAEAVIFARRRYEASAGTGYLELPVTSVAATSGFRRFVAAMALDAERFVSAYNAELGEYRVLHGTRSAAQPFPDLGREGTRLELPLWAIRDGSRTALWVEPVEGGGARLFADGEALCELLSDGDGAVAALADCGVLIAPKALALTLFTRAFACDLFIHGIGGGRYDRVTDGVFRRYWGVEPPAFVVASLTMYLPTGVHFVSEGEVAHAKERLNRLTHNPDSLLGEVEFDTEGERTRALSLAGEKSRLVAEIAAPDADKKVLGARIREVNAQLAAILEPLRASFTEELAALETQAAAAEVLTDRTYPFCFWDPSEIADKVG